MASWCRPNALISTEAVTAPLIFVQGGTKLEDIPNEVNGKIVLFERGTTVTDYNKQVENAVSKGAKGVLLYSLIGGRGNYGQTFNPRLMKSNLSLSLVLLMRKEMHLKKKSLKRDNNSFLKARHESKLTSLNVIAKRNQRRVQVMKKQSL